MVMVLNLISKKHSSNHGRTQQDIRRKRKVSHEMRHPVRDCTSDMSFVASGFAIRDKIEATSMIKVR
jgi:hypothetical protein